MISMLGFASRRRHRGQRQLKKINVYFTQEFHHYLDPFISVPIGAKPFPFNVK